MSLHSTQYTPRVSNAIALHFPPAVNDFPSVSFTALLTAHFTLFTLYPLHRSPNHLQLQSFLSITSHPLANSLVPNPNERGTPLSFGVPPFSSVFHLLWTNRHIQNGARLHSTPHLIRHTPHSIPHTQHPILRFKVPLFPSIFPLLFSFFHRIAHCTVYTPYCTLHASR